MNKRYDPRKWGRLQRAYQARQLWIQGVPYQEVGDRLGGVSASRSRELVCWLHRYERRLIRRPPVEPWQQARVLLACAGRMTWAESERRLTREVFRDHILDCDFFRWARVRLKGLTEIHPEWAGSLGRALEAYDELEWAFSRGERPSIPVSGVQDELLRLANVMAEVTRIVEERSDA